jgi:hypothetical protein
MSRIRDLMTAEDHERLRVLILAGMVRAIRDRVDAALVMQEGDGDEVVDRLVAQGWTLESRESIGSKRVRTLRAPTPDGSAEENALNPDGTLPPCGSW